MRNLLKFGILFALVPFGAQAQNVQLPVEKPLAFRTNGYRVEPYVAGLSERINPHEKDNHSLSPQGTWRNRLLIGAQGEANGMEFKAGIVLNGKQPLQIGIKANLF
jgi:hypothetical protein